VKDCTKVIEYDVATKKNVQIGSTKDAVLAMHVSTTKLREIDRN